MEICCIGELHSRMVEAGVKGKSISLKVKRRKSDAPEPYKFLGHGPCDNVSRSVTLNRFTDSANDLAMEAKTLLRALKIPADQLRGVGISVSSIKFFLITCSFLPHIRPIPWACWHWLVYLSSGLPLHQIVYSVDPASSNRLVPLQSSPL